MDKKWTKIKFNKFLYIYTFSNEICRLGEQERKERLKKSATITGSGWDVPRRSMPNAEETSRSDRPLPADSPSKRQNPKAKT